MRNFISECLYWCITVPIVIIIYLIQKLFKMKKLLLLPIIFLFVNVQAQVKFGMFVGAGKAPIVGIQTGYDYKGFYLNANLIGKASAIEPPQAEIRLNYTKVRLSPYIGLNRELWQIKGEKAKPGIPVKLSYGIQWQGAKNDEAFFNRLDRLFISAGMVDKTPMVLVGGVIQF